MNRAYPVDAHDHYQLRALHHAERRTDARTSSRQDGGSHSITSSSPESDPVMYQGSSTIHPSYVPQRHKRSAIAVVLSDRSGSSSSVSNRDSASGQSAKRIRRSGLMTLYSSNHPLPVKPRSLVSSLRLGFSAKSAATRWLREKNERWRGTKGMLTDPSPMGLPWNSFAPARSALVRCTMVPQNNTGVARLHHW